MQPFPFSFWKTAASAFVSYSTSFSGGAQNPISTPWVSGPGAFNDIAQTAGSKCEGSGGNSAGVITVASYNFGANQEATITLDSTGSIGPVVRGSESTSVSYVGYLASGKVLVLKKDAALADTQIGGDVTISSQNAGDTLTLRATGTSTVTLTVYINGVSQGSVTDSTSPIASGQPGYYANGFGSITGFSATGV